jgi:hypothetical protein
MDPEPDELLPGLYRVRTLYRDGAEENFSFGEAAHSNLAFGEAMQLIQHRFEHSDGEVRVAMILRQE